MTIFVHNHTFSMICFAHAMKFGTYVPPELGLEDQLINIVVYCISMKFRRCRSGSSSSSNRHVLFGHHWCGIFFHYWTCLSMVLIEDPASKWNCYNMKYLGLSIVSMLLSVIQIKMEEWLYSLMVKMQVRFRFNVHLLGIACRFDWNYNLKLSFFLQILIWAFY